MTSLFVNEDLSSLLHIAKAFARDSYNKTVGPPHLLQALFHHDSGLTGFLTSLGKDIAYLRDWTEVRMEEYPKVSVLTPEPEEDESIDAIMEEADNVRLRFGLDELSPLCVLAAIIKPHTAFTAIQLKSLPLTAQEIFTAFRLQETNSPAPTFLETRIGQAETIGGSLAKYCTDKTALARAGRLDPIIGREAETRQMIEILGRRSKPNVIIAGEPGVGKTALVDGFAQAIIRKNVPLHLQHAVLLELDLGALVAGAAYKGEVEDRLKKIIAEIKQLDRAILFIDEMHMLLDTKGSMGSGAGNLLKPELARGELTVIGATTLEEYRKIIEPEQAFNRRFELLQVAEPDVATAIKMVSLLAEHYEAHHKITIEPGAIPECVRLAKRYIKDKRLPDAALDLLDRTMSAVRMMDETSEKELEAAQEKFNLRSGDATLSVQDRIVEWRWFHRQLKAGISPILYGQLTDEPEIEKLDNADMLEHTLKNMLLELTKLSQLKKKTAGRLEIAAVVAARTGIPIGKIQTAEKEKLLNMEALLKRRMVGQEHALKTISDAVIESRSGINKAGQPMGSFFLLGPTGTGKTELAKSIAELLFNDEQAMIRFDMSEFKEEHSAALLYGAPPGYIGYEEGGMLVNKIRQQPYSVVLFDEIEKAHQSVFDVFLQIMDEGVIHDKLGKEGDFSNALILFTSNIGSEQIIEQFSKGVQPKSTELMEIMANRFRPEFLARITEIIPFTPITENMALEIFDIQMRSLHDALRKQNILLTVSDKAKRMLALNGFTPKYGARQIGSVIRQQIRRPVSKMIVEGKAYSNSHIMMDIDAEEIVRWEINKPDSPNLPSAKD